MNKKMMKNKTLLTLILSSAMIFMWACSEGDIMNADDADEMVMSKLDYGSKNAISDYEFAQTFLKYCNSKEGQKNGCKAEYIGSCSSVEVSSSSFLKLRSSSSAVSSSSVKKSSSSIASSSSVRKSSSSNASSSSRKSSSSQSGPQISGKCDLVAPPVVYVDDEIMWRYLPDENSIDSADYTWTDVNKNKDVENSLIDGELSGSGLPEITVKFTAKGKKLGPTLVFGGKEFDCKNLIVHVVGEEISSSSEEESSSSAKSSSSRVRSSSSAVPEGHCMASKREIFVGDSVEWYVAGPDGEVLSAYHNWTDLGAGGTLVSGELKGNNSSKIVVTYSTAGQKAPMAQFAKQTIDCNVDEEGDILLTVKAKATSSSAAAPKESSSSESAKSSSSKAAPKSSSSFDIIDI